MPNQFTTIYWYFICYGKTGWFLGPCLMSKAIAAVVRGSSPNRSRLSAEVIGEALRYWYWRYKQLPRGVSIHAPVVEEWAVRSGVALRKLVTLLHSMYLNHLLGYYC